MTEIDTHIPDLTEKVYYLRMAGKSWTQITEELQADTPVRPSITWAHTAFRSFQNKLIMDLGPDTREQALSLELERLNALLAAVWPSAMKGDEKSVTAALRVVNLRARLLGLDQLDTRDPATAAQVLIIGGDQRAFIEALESGRRSEIVAGAPSDDEDDLSRED